MNVIVSNSLLIVGTDGPDFICGGSADNTVRALGGDDIVFARGGNDVVFGGDGDDVIFGGRRGDLLRGGAGNDSLAGNAGSDRLLGGSGNDSALGGRGRDVLLGNGGDDILSGNFGNDRIDGGRGDDELRGGVGRDDLNGGPGTDRCTDRLSTATCEARNAANPDCVPFCGVALGSTDRRQDNLDLSVQEAILGQQLDLVRLYITDPDGTFFKPAHQTLADEGRTLVYSWKVSRDNTNSPAWAQVASGVFDDQLVRAANQIKASGHMIFFALHHEPEDNVGTYGTEADYVAMYQHVYDIMNPIAGDQMVWFINYMGHSFGSFEQVEAMYPGDHIIDWISWNPYNWYGCHADGPWKTFTTQASPFYRWATATHPDKPLMIGETATNERDNNPNAKAEWITDMASALEMDFPRIRALLWFHQSNDTNFCERRWDSSQPSIDAFSAMAQDPYFEPSGPITGTPE